MSLNNTVGNIYRGNRSNKIPSKRDCNMFVLQTWIMLRISSQVQCSPWQFTRKSFSCWMPTPNTPSDVLSTPVPLVTMLAAAIASDICLWLSDNCCLLLMNKPRSETFLVNKSIKNKQANNKQNKYQIHHYVYWIHRTEQNLTYFIAKILEYLIEHFTHNIVNINRTILFLSTHRRLSVNCVCKAVGENYCKQLIIIHKILECLTWIQQSLPLSPRPLLHPLMTMYSLEAFLLLRAILQLAHRLYIFACQWCCTLPTGCLAEILLSLNVNKTPNLDYGNWGM